MISCEKCEVAGTASIFTLSDDLVLKLADGVEPKIQETKGLSKDLNELEWIEKIRCIDNAHSVAYHLNEDGFNLTARNIETMLGKDRKVCHRLRDALINCLKENPNCAIKCKDLIDELAETYDLDRVQRIKKYYDERRGKYEL